MIEFDLTENEDGVWFDYFESRVEDGKIIYDEPIKDGPRVKIRSIAPFILERLKTEDKKKVSEFVLNTKTNGMDRITYIPESTMEEKITETDDMNDYAIIEIEGFVNKKTKALIESTKENKIKIARIPVFGRFMDRCQEIIKGDETKKAEEEEKN